MSDQGLELLILCVFSPFALTLFVLGAVMS